MSRIIQFLLSISLWCGTCEASLLLRDNLKRAQAGDFIVTMQNKAYTLFHIYRKSGDLLTIEEITIPQGKIPSDHFSWKEWVRQGAQQHTNWILYNVQLTNGATSSCFSVSRNGWYDMSQRDSFLPTLLNLQFVQIPLDERKKVGPPPHGDGPDFRKIWNPKMVVNGVIIPDVMFDVLRTHWPKDGSELSGKTIEIYIPQEGDKYPSYLPYWLQIKGSVGGAATLRIVDSGTGLVSPARLPQQNA